MAITPKREISDYADIIDLPHHVSKVRPQMTLEKRATQFAPFAALSGYGDLVDETARLVEPRKVLDVQQREGLDNKLQFLDRHAGEHPPVSVVYYEEDRLKDGGSYQMCYGSLRRIDPLRGVLILDEGKEILLEDLYAIESPLLLEAGMED